MSNQFGGNKNPPWARQDFGNQNNNMVPANVSYPYNTAQQQYAQQQLGATGGNVQGAAAGSLMSQAGLAGLPTSQANSQQLGTVSYPVKTHQNSSSGNKSNQQPKQKIFTGSVTKMHENFGFVDEEVFFQVSCVKGMVPKVGDKVLVEASFNASMPFKWNATRVICLTDGMGSSQISALQHQQQQQQQHQQLQQHQQQQLKAIQQQAIGLMGVSGLIGAGLGAGALGGGQGLLGNPGVGGPRPLMGGLNKFQGGGNLYNSGSRSGINTGPGLLGDPGPRALLAAAAASAKPIIHSGPGKDRDRRDNNRGPRDRRDMGRDLGRDVGRDVGRDMGRDTGRDVGRDAGRDPVRRKRSRSPVTKRSSPPPRARSPPRRRENKVRPAPRYVVQVPKIQVDVQETNVVSLKGRYNHLYIPSDFFHASYSWVENFPLTRPFTLGKTCSFHIMHKDVEQLGSGGSTLEPSDADHLFSAKVMLLASPTDEELFKKSCCLAEDMPDCLDNQQHPTRLINFLVGTRGKNEPMAIGGPWSPSLDGPNPQANPLVLIKTAVRTTKALTGIDLSNCTQWYRFAEIRYFRPESKHKDRVQPARVETVVLFLPDVWTCNPTRLEWDSLQQAYQKQLQMKLNPEAVQQQEEEEENEEETGEKPPEPSHYSALDPKTMKVGDLRNELELRTMSPKGLKSQLIARLSKCLKSEEEKDLESRDLPEETPTVEENSKEPEKMDVVEEEAKSESKKKEEEEQMRKEKKERALLERRYKLPEKPSIVVHPSPTAKGGKFECTLMSLSLLLDYRQEDNKEHSFEVSLFAEIFNEMLMRDFGFQIYKSIVCAPSLKKEEETKKDKDDKRDKDKDDKKDKEKDDKREKDKDDKREKDRKEKDDRKKNGDASSPKRSKRDDKDEKKDEAMDIEGEEIEEQEEERKDRGTQVFLKVLQDEKKKKKYGSKTTNPKLLLAFSYFDQNHCGYLTDTDTEAIVHTLGLKLSRAQSKKIIQRVMVRDSFNYRKLTDQAVDEDGKPITPEQEETTVQKTDAEIAKGNKESLRKLLQLSGAKVDPPSTGQEDSKDNPSFVSYKGSFLDIESLMSRLDKSEKSRTALENSLSELNGELKSTKDKLQESTSLTSKLQGDVKDFKSDLDHQKKTLRDAEMLNREWMRTAEHSKAQLQGAMYKLENMINKESKKEKSEASKKEVKKESEDKERKESKKESDDKEKTDSSKREVKKETEDK